MAGCECGKDNGRHIGCEYLSFECLADSSLIIFSRTFANEARRPKLTFDHMGAKKTRYRGEKE